MYYNNLSTKNSYSAEYLYNLSLIYSLDLSEIYPLPEINMLGKWALYKDTLDGKPVFASG